MLPTIIHSVQELSTNTPVRTRSFETTVVVVVYTSYAVNTRCSQMSMMCGCPLTGQGGAFLGATTLDFQEEKVLVEKSSRLLCMFIIDFDC